MLLEIITFGFSKNRYLFCSNSWDQPNHTMQPDPQTNRLSVLNSKKRVKKCFNKTLISLSCKKTFAHNICHLCKILRDNRASITRRQIYRSASRHSSSARRLSVTSNTTIPETDDEVFDDKPSTSFPTQTDETQCTSRTQHSRIFEMVPQFSSQMKFDPYGSNISWLQIPQCTSTF